MSLADFCLLLPEYLGRNPQERDRVRTQLLARLQSSVSSEKELSEILAHLGLQSRCWTEEDLAEFEKAGRECLSASDKSTKTQDFTSFPAYIPLSLWQRIQACDDDYSKAIILGRFLGALGLRWPSEQTVGFFQAFILLASSQDHSKDTPPAVHRMYKASKNLLKLVIEKTEIPFGNPPFPRFLPTKQEELDAIWFRHAMGMEKPMTPPPFDMTRMTLKVTEIPMRKTHKSLIQASLGEESNVALKTLGDVAKSAFSLVKRQGLVDRQGEARIRMLTSPGKAQPEVALVPFTEKRPAEGKPCGERLPPQILQASQPPVETSGSDVSKHKQPSAEKPLPPSPAASGVLTTADKLGKALDEDKKKNVSAIGVMAKPAAALEELPKGMKRKPAAAMGKAPSKKPAARLSKADEPVSEAKPDLVLMVYHTTGAVALRQRNGKQLLQVKKQGCTLEQNKAFAQKLLDSLKRGNSLDKVLDQKKKWLAK